MRDFVGENHIAKDWADQQAPGPSVDDPGGKYFVVEAYLDSEGVPRNAGLMEKNGYSGAWGYSFEKLASAIFAAQDAKENSKGAREYTVLKVVAHTEAKG